MKIGIFDSGLGGLIIAKAIRKVMPEYDYVYLGDTKRVPYGNRSHEAVFEFTKEAMNYLFKKENCAIVIIACNTASARALKELQKKYLPKNFPSRKILGVLIPTAEEAAKFMNIRILATAGTVASESFPKEIKKINKWAKVSQNPAPMLVPLAEEGEKVLAKRFIIKYLKPLLAKSRRPKASGNIDALVLGCTHYPIFKNEFKNILPRGIKLISQDEIVPKKLKDYLLRHPEIEKRLKKTPNQSKARYEAGNKAKILVTDITPNIIKLSKKWFGGKIKPKLINF